jgi:hypothetical protein
MQDCMISPHETQYHVYVKVNYLNCYNYDQNQYMATIYCLNSSYAVATNNVLFN